MAIPLAVIVFLLDQVAFAEPLPSSNDLALGYAGQYEQIVDESQFVLVAITESLLSVIAYLLILGASFRAVSELYLGRQTSVGSSISAAREKLGSLLWLGLLLVLGLAIGFLFFVIPGIYLLIAWSVAVPALMVENVRGSKALGRSNRLVRQNWWRVFGALLVGLIFIGLFQFLLGLAAEGLTSVTEDSKQGSLLIIDSFQALAMIITAPLQAAIVTVVYYDLRVRKEGFDVQLLAEGVESGSAPPQAAGAGAAPETGPGAGAFPAPERGAGAGPPGGYGSGEERPSSQPPPSRPPPSRGP